MQATHGLQCLSGDQWLRSLGGVYGENTDPRDRFISVIEKMMERLRRLQHRRPSLAARVLFSNSIISSCVWFFSYFIPPTSTQTKHFDDIVWAMLWGSDPDTLRARGLKNRGVMTAPKHEGGWQVLLPSIMIPALQANMVNRAITDRGRWWTRFFVWFLERASPTRRGLDALAHPPDIKHDQLASPFWVQAVKSWKRLDWTHLQTSHPHREHVAARPIFELGGIEVSRQLQRVFTSGNYHLVGDVWDFTTQNLTLVPHIVQSLEQERAQLNVPQLTLENGTTHLLYSIESANFDLLSALRIVRDTVGDQPRTGQLWGAMDADVTGRVSAVAHRGVTTVLQVTSLPCTLFLL